MKNAVVMMDMFTMLQKVFVYEDGNTIDVLYPSINALPEFLCELNEKYQLSQISLVGAKKYIKGYQKKIEQAAVAKYGKNTLNIVLMKGDK